MTSPAALAKDRAVVSNAASLNHPGGAQVAQRRAHKRHTILLHSAPAAVSAKYQ